MKKNRVLLLLTLFCVAILKVHAQKIPIEIVNNSVFPDDKVYVAIIGKKVSDDAPIYYDLIANNASDAALRTLTVNTNTLHKFNGDRGYANVFTPLNQIKNKTIYVDKTHACRMFFGFNSPLYLHVNDNNGGYAGADMQNPSDPNIDLRWELIEFTYDRYGVMFINTTRVDAFQYPMGLELYGNASAGANNPYTKRGEVNTYEEIINRWKTQNEGNIFSNCLKNNITHDNLGGIIMQPSKVAEVKNTGYFDGYINRIWSEFRNKDIHVNMGNQLGVWRGRVNGNNFVLKSESGPRQGQTAIVGKPTSIDVIEGAGEFARSHGNSADLPVQAMFCGAMNRGVIKTNLADGELQDWGDTGSFFNTDVYNPYVKFFHQKDISYDGYTYAFAYDDTFDQSSTCTTSHPERAVVTIGGFKGQSGTKKCDDCMAILYADSDYRGYSKSLGEGSYTQADLAMYGISAKDISSLKVTKGFKITLYENADFTGNSKSWTTDASFVGGDWNDKACSVRIEPNGKSGLSGNFKIMNRNSGKYLDLDNNKTDNNTAIVQFDDEGVDASQTWTFTEVMKGKGVYSICSYGNKNRGMDVADFSKENGAQVQLYDYLGNPHQQFILYDCGEGYYQLVARNSGKVVEIPQSSKGNGEWIKIYDNNGTHTQQWAVVENRYDEASAVTLYTDKGYKGKAVTLSEGEYNLSRMGLYNLKDNDMSSLKVTPGFKVTIYEDDNFNGKSKSYTASESFVGEEWNDKMSSLKVEAYGKSGLSGDYKLQNRNSGKFLDLDNNNTDNKTAIVQYDDEYIDATQIWTLTEIGGEKGVYSICTSVNKRQGMDVADWSKDNGAQVQLYEYNGNRNQQFIVVEKGDGYYQFVSRLSGKVIEIPSSSKDNGEWIKLYDNNGTNTQQWKFVSPSVYSGIANTESLSGMNLRKEGNTIIVTGAKGKELTIYDVSGRLIRCETIDSAKYSMSLDKMKAGIYIMKIDSIAKKIRVEL